MSDALRQDSGDGVFEQYRALMFSIAYRMLGTVMDAEDIVQEAYLRYQKTPREQIDSPRAFLSTIVTRLCLNQLNSARTQRETYIGPWLPEPVVTDADSPLVSPLQKVTALESISMAFLVLLESLSPAERAVFLLREVFDYEYDEIARILEKSPEACRQLFSRAKKHVTANCPRFETTPEAHQQLLSQFLLAVTKGDLVPITQMLAEDVVVYSDGGGKRQAAINPIYGPDRAARFIVGARRFTPQGEGTLEFQNINGRPAAVLRVDGHVYLVIDVETRDGKITHVNLIINPDKLSRLDD